MENKYAKFSVPQLKEELKRRGATTRGKKADLLERYKITLEIMCDTGSDRHLYQKMTIFKRANIDFLALESSELFEISGLFC